METHLFHDSWREHISPYFTSGLVRRESCGKSEKQGEPISYLPPDTNPELCSLESHLEVICLQQGAGTQL